MSLDAFFHLKEYKTDIHTEILAGVTIFFAMAYILEVNPNVLGAAGMPTGAVYLATAITTVFGCLMLGLFANVPLAQSAGLALNSFFTYTIVLTFGYTWQQALSMVFICGIINLIISLTKIRSYIIASIPDTLKIAIGCGIGLFIAFIGFKNGGLITISEGMPALNKVGLASDPAVWIFLIGCLFTLILVILKVRGALVISITAATIIGLIPFFGVTKLQSSVSITDAFCQLPETFGVIFTSEGLQSLFAVPSAIPGVILTIAVFSCIDIFDTIGSLIGAGRETNLFTRDEIEKMNSGERFSTRTECTLISDAAATIFGSIMGTSNMTAYAAESVSGIQAGGRTGLTAVTTAVCFALCIPLVPLATLVPISAAAPALILAGIAMLKHLGEIEWSNLETAIPCFFTTVFMAFTCSITDGIAIGFITYCIIKICKRETKTVYASVWIITALFIAYMAINSLSAAAGAI